MRNIFFLVFGLTLAASSFGQKPYLTSDGEVILGFASITQNGVEEQSIPRFTMFFHGQSLIHFDRHETSGFFTGFSLRNVGFIYDQDASTRKKYRTYNVGIPIGFKIGDMDNMYVYGGYELEMPFNYKEKTFINEKKEDKFNVWFSNRTPTFYHALFAGVRFPHGLSLKVKYYLTPFFNQNYTQIANGTPVKPFENLDVNTFHLALSTMITNGKKVVKRD
ncbi:MAG: hypothetical protein RI909_2287 [Bacteroidota bacterium]